ncbi:TRAP transporter small permease [Microbacterium esteraromaticum]|uniref:TRAP transporter small permease n=1 Tax=Microbacterium esteraromaticum TaxID=57043 RepID=UPI001CD21FCD|nr:TRAP transporter small permease [Microbacterium esteraromaticum]MCA1307850.1 TRAP transporter small permease [Microbacterium esteraromaticum]
MRKWTKRLERGALYLGAAILLIMMVNIVADVTMRSVLNRPITGTLEVTIYWWMVAITALGLWAAELKHDHIAVTLVTDRLSYSSRFVHAILVRAVTVAFMLALAWFGIQTAVEKSISGEFTGSAEIPIWPTRFFLPLAAVAFAILGILRLIRQLRTGRLEREATLDAEILQEQS